MIGWMKHYVSCYVERERRSIMRWLEQLRDVAESARARAERGSRDRIIHTITSTTIDELKKGIESRSYDRS